jgi:predicted nucleic acid-binding protein
MDGRLEAERRNPKVAGTLGIPVGAHRGHLLDLDSALTRLSETSFYLSPTKISLTSTDAEPGSGIDCPSA